MASTRKNSSRSAPAVRLAVVAQSAPDLARRQRPGVRPLPPVLLAPRSQLGSDVQVARRLSMAAGELSRPGVEDAVSTSQRAR